MDTNRKHYLLMILGHYYKHIQEIDVKDENHNPKISCSNPTYTPDNLTAFTEFIYSSNKNAGTEPQNRLPLQLHYNPLLILHIHLSFPESQ